jgi:hypothetical protein
VQNLGADGGMRIYLSAPRKLLAARRRSLALLSMALITVLAMFMTVERGEWLQTATFRGPFEAVGKDPNKLKIVLITRIPFLSLAPIEHSNVRQTQLRVWTDNLAGSAERFVDAAIRKRPLFGIGNLRQELAFNLPPDVANNDGARVGLDYRVRVRPAVFNAVLIATALAIPLWLATLNVTGARTSRMGRRLSPLLTLAFLVASWMLASAAVLYVLATAYGMYVGYALPTTTLYRIVSAFDLTVAEALLPASILLFASAGASVAWLSYFRLVPPSAARRAETRLIRFWGCWDLPMIICLFLFSLSAGGWSANIRSVDMNYMSVAGLVPNADARSYFGDAFHQAVWGHWLLHGSRRPVSQAFRDVTVFAGGYSYVNTLLAQLGMLSLAVWLAARQLASWRGIWAGIGFFGLMYVLVRPFLSTVLIEPLALIWSLFALLYLIAAVRSHSIAHALIGITGMTFALLTRPGGVLAIPLLVCWATLAFAGSLSERMRVLACASTAVLAAFLVSFLIAALYSGSHTTVPERHIAWTACGLALGTTWLGCERTYAAEIASFANDRETMIFLLGKAWENIRSDPTPLLNMLYNNVSSFMTEMPHFLLNGYGNYTILTGETARLILLLLIPGLLFSWIRFASKAERLLWPAAAIGISASAAVVLRDDGWRVLAPTHVLVIAFLALGFAAPRVVTCRRTVPSLCSWQVGAAALAAIVALLLFGPLLSRVVGAGQIAARPVATARNNDEHVVLGGRHLTGFAVLPDGEDLPNFIPAIHASQFRELIRVSHIEDWEAFGPFLRDMAARTPFVFIVANRLDRENPVGTYIAPIVVLQQRAVRAWRFKLRPDLPFMVQQVLHAEPVD